MDACGSDKNVRTVSFKVAGMSCGHCKAAIEKCVGGVEGVTGVKVDLATKNVDVTYDPSKVDEAQLRDAIEDSGYDVE